MQMQASPVLSPSPSSPSFNNYCSGRLAEIAARVVEEFRQEPGSQDDIYETWSQPKQHQQQVIEKEGNYEDDDFEFAFVCREAESSPISADEIFHNGQIRPTYPLFNTNLLNDDRSASGWENVNSTAFVSNPGPRRSPLRKLMSEERETTSSSSSEADELDGVASGTYCVWTPKGGSSGNIDQESPGRCKKSNSTGSSKRWKLRDLLYRSNSDGKDKFVFLAPTKRDKTSNVDINKVIQIPGKFKEAEKHCDSSNRDMKGDKRKTFLPYRQDLVKIFSNANGLNRNLHPF